MSDHEIMTALAKCMSAEYFETDCTRCPYYSNPWCQHRLQKDALAIIKHQKAEIESLSREIDKLLKRIPTADTAEVVRCKDCRYYRADTLYCRENNLGYCSWDEIIKQKNHFCAYGERR